MSVAAKRDCRFTATPQPSRAKPSSSSGKLRTAVAATVPAAPARDAAVPAASAMRLPLRCARRASGMATAAAPSVLRVAAAPAKASLPATSVASAAPMESVAPMPRPPRI